MRLRMGKAGAGIGILMAAGWLAFAQFGSRPPFPNQPGFGDSDVNPVMEAKRLKALNADRHKNIVSDTDKLVKLARELDAEIASNPTDRLTPEELQKVASIEKLAHSVKSKMAQSFGGGPEIKEPTIDSRGPYGP
jgi:hypothetical protein